MRAIWTIAQREVFSFFVSPVAYVVLTVWLLLNGVSLFTFAQIFAYQQYDVGAVTHTPLTLFFGGSIFFYLAVLIVVPLLTMRTLAEENRSGTIEPLLTAPVTETQMVLGKYLALIADWTVLWIPTLLYVVIIANYGDVDWGVVGASYLGVFTIGLYYMALGLFMSAVSKSQVVAAVLTFLLVGMLFLLGIAGQFVFDGTTAEVFSYASVWGHMEDFAKGLVDTRPIAFSVSLAAVALFLTVLVMRRSVSAKKIAAIGGKALVGAVELSAVGIGLVLLLAIAGMLNYLSYRHYARWDWTEDAVFTLSERTEQELRALTQPIDVYLFLSQGEGNYAEVRELLERYQAVSDRVRVEHVDPDRNPSEFRMHAQRFGINTAMTEGGQTLADVAAVVARGDTRWTITRDDLRSFDFDSLEEGEPRIDVRAEQAFTGAIVQVTSGRPTKVCVTTGHGEWDVSGGSERSLFALKDELARDNVELEPIETIGGRAVPEGCDAVFVIGPARAFGDDEAAQLRAYLDRGGNALFALDPVIERDRIEPTGLEGMLAEIGVRVSDSLVLELDPSRVLPPGNPAGPFLVTTYGQHRTVEALERLGGPALFSMARAIEPIEGGGGSMLLETSEAAFAETDVASLAADAMPERGAGDIAGPVPLAVALQKGGEAAEPEEDGEAASGGRVVVVGDAEWLTGEFLRDGRFTNYDLASAWTGWLTEREALIAIQPKQVSATPMTITEGDLGGLAFRLIVLMPAAMLLLGVAMWWSRRS